MRIFSDLSRKYTLKELQNLVNAIAFVNWDYLCLVDEHCDLAFKSLMVKAARSPFSLPKTYPYTYLLPKSEAGYAALSQNWHEVMSLIFPQCDYKFSPAQNLVIEQSRHNFKTPISVVEQDLEAAQHSDAVLEGNRLISERNALEEGLHFQILTEELARIAPPVEERDHLYPFERWRPSDSCLSPRLMVDLKPLSWFFQQGWDATVYVAYLRKQQLRIKQTRSFRQHATKRLGLGFKEICELYVFVNGVVTAFDEQEREIPNLHGAKQAIIKRLGAFDLAKTRFWYVYAADRLIPLTSAQFTLACSTDWEPEA